MKKIVNLILILSLTGLAAWSVKRGVSNYHDPDAAEEADAAAAAAEEPVEKGLVAMDEDTMERLVILTKKPVAHSHQASTQAWGQVVDPLTLVTGASDIAAATAALEASKADFDRTQQLFTTGENVSKKIMETATAAYKADTLKLAALKQNISLAWGKLAESDAAFLDKLTNGSIALARVSLPPGISLAEAPAAAKIALTNDVSTILAAGKVHPATALDPKELGQSWLVEISGQKYYLPAGTPLTAWLQQGTEKKTGMLVPRSAIVRYQGESWVYVQKPEHEEEPAKAEHAAEAEEEPKIEFLRTLVKTDTPLEEGWFITEGLALEEEIVVEGAAAVLTAETNTHAEEE